MTSPVFVVVGHVNRGKSSVVATLSADDSVRIDAMPGTTIHCREYPAIVGGELLYTLIDTPGFERPRQVLAWLRQCETTTHERREVVEAFVREHTGGTSFRQECELLAPVLAGAAILYVVDGSKPPSPKDEAEMEILRWTARPRVALLNLIDKPATDGDCITAWKRLLDQYFNLVRVFDAHEADFEERLRLLKTLREMEPDFAAPLDRAIRSLAEDRRYALRECATATADMLVEMLSLSIEKKLPASAPADRDADKLTADYCERLRRRERKCHRELQEIFLHRRLQITEPALSPVADDLLAVGTWNRLGLSRTQLLAAGTAAGAAVGAKGGAVIDVAVGGHSLFLGALFGGVVGGAAGGAAGWLGGTKLPQVRLLGLPLGGRLQRIGPMKNANFPWIVLDRALLLLDTLVRRSHARREPVTLGEPAAQDGLVAQLPWNLRKELENQFTRIRKSSASAGLDEARGELARIIETLLNNRYPTEHRV